MTSRQKRPGGGLALRRMTEAAMIAALYTAATVLLAPISFGPMQLRVSEALTLLPVLTPSAAAGLTLGCAIANAIGVTTGANICGALDIALGSAATLLAAIVTRLLRKAAWGRHKLPLLAALPPVVFNGLIVGGEISAVYGLPLWLCAAEVAAGELAAVAVIGLPLTVVLRRTGLFGEERLPGGRDGGTA